MSRIPDNKSDEILTQGLREIAVPEVSSDFDAGVRARLRRPQSRWEWLWSAARPALAPAGLSLAVTLAALIVAGSPKPGASPGVRKAQGGSIALVRPERQRSIEEDLDRLDRETPSLGGFRGSRAEPRATAPQTPPHGRRGASGRGGRGGHIGRIERDGGIATGATGNPFAVAPAAVCPSGTVRIPARRADARSGLQRRVYPS